MGSRWEGRCSSCGGPEGCCHAWCIRQANVPRGAAEAAKAESLRIGGGILVCLFIWAVAICIIAGLIEVAAHFPSLDVFWVVGIVFLGAYLAAGNVR